MIWKILDVLSLLLMAGAFYKHFLDNWTKRGLTDTGWISLAVFCLGTALGAIATLGTREWWLAVLYLPLTVGSAYLILLKVRDLIAVMTAPRRVNRTRFR